MTTPFPFVSAAVLTAAQMNAITTLVTSTKTASHTLTISDVSTRVIMNSASATTITVNTSIFGASDVLEILNIGAGVCTVTAGTCTVGTSGSLALAQNAGGKLTFISAGVSVFQANGVAATAGGMTLISATSMTGQNVNINNCFSATYSSYLVTFDNVIFNNSTGRSLDFRLRVGGVDDSTANSYTNTKVYGYTSTVGAQSATSTNWDSTTVNNTGAFFGSFLLFGPFTAAKTNGIFNFSVYSNSGFQVLYNAYGSHNQATSYDGLSILQSGQSFSSGTTRVYGLQNS